MTKRSIALLIISSLALGMNLSPASAAVKPGSACKTEGQITTTSGKKYTCVKKGKKLVWSKGVKSASSDDGISVDKNLFSVDVTIPASFYEDQKLTQAGVEADAAKSGFGKAKLNSDGSVSFRMSKAQHKAALADMKKSVDDYIQESVNESPKIFKKISYNSDMTEFNISVDKANYEDDFGAGFIGLGIAFQASFYQMFNGTQTPKTELKLIDASTGKVFDTQQWPEKE
jgi:hypothetical protein